MTTLRGQLIRYRHPIPLRLQRPPPPLLPKARIPHVGHLLGRRPRGRSRRLLQLLLLHGRHHHRPRRRSTSRQDTRMVRPTRIPRLPRQLPPLAARMPHAQEVGTGGDAPTGGGGKAGDGKRDRRVGIKLRHTL